MIINDCSSICPSSLSPKTPFWSKFSIEMYQPFVNSRISQHPKQKSLYHLDRLILCQSITPKSNHQSTQSHIKEKTLETELVDTMFRYALILFCAAAANAEGEIRIQAMAIKDIGPRIVNGDEAILGQFPWQVGILGRNAAYSYFCGGSLINEEWVLTAAHCLEGAISATIYSGTTKISNPNRVVSQAVEFVMHEGYVSGYLTNDIGLIRLAKPLTFDEGTQAVALAIRDPTVGTNVTVSGWGVTSDSDVYTSDILYYTTVDVIENTACARIYGSAVIWDGVICANSGDPHTSPCQGDSGAPVVVLNSCGKPVQIGVFSFTNGYGCEFSYPSGNTRVAYYRDWIREKTGI